ncbi:MAG: aminoglycoside phosphotransferase family protein [Micromonosporaceae bacterium]
MTTRMHDDELEIDTPLVRRLLAAQFPRWAELPLERIVPSGTDNALYRLGDELVVRLPRIHWAVDDVAKEQRWLPALAPYLPVAIPAPVAVGGPGEGYPWQWSVNRWLRGQSVLAVGVPDQQALALRLAEFVTAFRRVPLPGGPSSGRTAPVRTRDEAVRRSIASAADVIDAALATEVWERVLAAPDWDGPDVWAHGDLLPGNLLVSGGTLSAVIDFGATGTGDPACDVISAWSVFSGEGRDVFRDAVDVDDATWTRGRGWALFVAVSAMAYYLHTNPVMVRIARHILRELAADAD